MLLRLLVLALLVGCGKKDETDAKDGGQILPSTPVQVESPAPSVPNPIDSPAPAADVEKTAAPALPLDPGAPPAHLRDALAQRGVVALRDADFRRDPNDAKIWLGRLLFFDRILSGNKNVACSSCHAQRRATTDGVSQLADQGRRRIIGRFLFPQRAATLPRNTPSIFNRGHASVKDMFWDSRVRADGHHGSGFASPEELPAGLDSPLAAQAMLPVLAPDEMLGLPNENALARNPSARAVWSGLMNRLLSYGEYRDLFAASYPGVPFEAMGFQHAANAIAAFEETFWRADDSPFDRFLRGDDHALSQKEREGAALFYGKAGCGGCHSGAMQTDGGHHAIAVPQFGRGKGDGPSGLEDWGLGRVTNRVEDRYKFRTPSLRNVALTGPWGHSGAFGDLRTVVAHYANPAKSLSQWDPRQVEVLGTRYPRGFFDAHADRDHRAKLLAANELSNGLPLADAEIELLVCFLEALTDESFLDRTMTLPRQVPSGRIDFLGKLPDIEYSARRGLRFGILREVLFGGD